MLSQLAGGSKKPALVAAQRWWYSLPDFFWRPVGLASVLGGTQLGLNGYGHVTGGR